MYTFAVYIWLDMSLKPSIPKGTRDFTPEEVTARDYIFDTIRSVFRLYGYRPIETPAMENLSTLLGKYGEEGDKLLFRILNSGDFLSGLTGKDFNESDYSSLSSKICEKGLRYDLTVPFARYVVQHRNEITFPFRRYQIQPVWRADRPQKGRYREFYQCDVDVIGSDSLLNEYELLRIIDEVFFRLGISVVIRFNNRKVLAGMAELTGGADRLTDLTVAVDKLEKAGMEAVAAELISRGFSPEDVGRLRLFLEKEETNEGKLKLLKDAFASSEQGLKGVEEIETLFGYLMAGPLRSPVVLDLALARGLNYYTGAIIEVKSAEVQIGSICGGGRYDNLTGIFGLQDVSGVGVSFGADRIYDVLSQTGGFSGVTPSPSKVMIINFGRKELPYAIKIMTTLHQKGISAQIYPDNIKVGKQFAWAAAQKIPFVIAAGEEEIRNNEVTVKNMADGSQKSISFGKLGEYLG